MARKRRDPSPSSSSSDNEAPEAVTLSQSKHATQQREAAVRQARLNAKEKQKEKNRELDKKLKERAEVNKSVKEKRKGKGKGSDEGLKTAGKNGKGKKVDEEEDIEGFWGDRFGEGVDFDSEDEDFGDIDPQLEARMLKAMREAEEEEDGSEGSESSEDDGSDNWDGSGSNQEDEDVLSDDGEDDEEDSGDGDGGGDEEKEHEEDDHDDDDEVANPLKPTHLPDELFKSAFRQSHPTDTAVSKSKPTSKEPPRKRRRTREPKELSIGARKIRLLPDPSNQLAPNPPSTTPSKKINKFLDRSLALKGRAAKPKLGWERRPAHIGLLKSTNGPAARFVRNSN